MVTADSSGGFSLSTQWQAAKFSKSRRQWLPMPENHMEEKAEALMVRSAPALPEIFIHGIMASSIELSSLSGVLKVLALRAHPRRAVCEHLADH